MFFTKTLHRVPTLPPSSWSRPTTSTPRSTTCMMSATTSIIDRDLRVARRRLVHDIIAAKNRGVNVSIVLDGNPCCASLPDNETLWSATAVGGRRHPGLLLQRHAQHRRRRVSLQQHVHAKFMIVDDTWLADRLGELRAHQHAQRPTGPTARKGHRGAMIITNAPDVVAYAEAPAQLRLRPGQAMPTWCAIPALGTPPPGYSPTPLPDYTDYTVIKPTPAGRHRNRELRDRPVARQRPARPGTA